MDTMIFMMAVTFTALGMTICKLGGQFMTTGLSLGNTLQLIFAVLLLILGVIVAIQGIKSLQRRKKLNINGSEYKSTTYVQQQDDPCSLVPIILNSY